MTQYHLVKRDSDLNATRGKRRGGGGSWIVETHTNGRPCGYKVKPGDVIYFFEKGYAIWAKGVVKSANLFDRINTIDEFFSLSKNKFKYNNDSYWGQVILEKGPNLLKKNGYMYVLEVEVVSEILKAPIFLPEKLKKGQFSWKYLDGEIIDEEAPHELNTTIPSSLKLQLYEKYNLRGDAHYFDIDHVVPASVGGPGNIEENLVPMAFGINRYKSDRIPAGLFHVAKEIGHYKGKLPSEKGYLKNGQSNWKDEARIITMSVNNEKVDKVRDFYRKVRNYHFKNLYQQK